MHTINSVRDGVSKLLDVDLKSKKRDTKHFRARSVFYKLCFKLCYKPTYQAIGDSVNKNHATVLYSVKNFKNNLKFDPIMKDMYNTIVSTYKEYEGEDLTLPALLKDNDILKKRIKELEELPNTIEEVVVKVPSKYEEICLLNDLLDKLDDEEKYLLKCKLDALYKLNKGKIK
jgi:hypothetical protein